jgi:prefoldin subunit 5
MEMLHEETIQETEKFFHSLHETSFKDFYLYFKEIDEKHLKSSIDNLNQQIDFYTNAIKNLSEVWLIDTSNEDVKGTMVKHQKSIEILNYALESFQAELNHITSFPERMEEIKKKVSSKIKLKTFDDKKVKELIETFVEEIKLDEEKMILKYYHPYHQKIQGGWITVEFK